MTQTATQTPQSTKPAELNNPHDLMAGLEPTNPFAKALAGADTHHDGSGFGPTTDQKEQAAHQERIDLFHKNRKAKAEQRYVFDSRILETQREIQALQSQLATQAASMKNAKDEQVALFQAPTNVESIEGGRGRKSFLAFIGTVLKNLKVREASVWSKTIQGKKSAGKDMTAQIHGSMSNPDKNVAGFTSGQ